MKLHLETPGSYIIRAYGQGRIKINQDEFTSTVAITRDTLLDDWKPQSLEALTAEDLTRLLDDPPEVVIIGTGEQQRFPAPAVLAPLAQANCGIEVMDTGAACRTYNILAGEDRKVAALLFMI